MTFAISTNINRMLKVNEIVRNVFHFDRIILPMNHTQLKLLLAACTVTFSTFSNGDQLIMMPQGGTCYLSAGGHVWGCNIPLPPPVIVHTPAPERALSTAELAAKARRAAKDAEDAQIKRTWSAAEEERRRAYNVSTPEAVAEYQAKRLALIEADKAARRKAAEQCVIKPVMTREDMKRCEVNN